LIEAVHCDVSQLRILIEAEFEPD